jgi:hypothetical protein
VTGAILAAVAGMRHLGTIICLLTATACLGKTPSGPSPIEKEVVIAPGETAAVASDLRVGFVQVDGDSRCPTDVVCITAGDALVRITLEVGSDAVERDLHTRDKQPVSHAGVRVELMKLDPYPLSSRPIQPGEYRATLRITR